MNAPEFTTETGKQVFGAANKQAAAFPVLYIPFIWWLQGKAKSERIPRAQHCRVHPHDAVRESVPVAQDPGKSELISPRLTVACTASHRSWARAPYPNRMETTS